MDPAPLAPASAAEKTAWILMGAALLFILEYHLVPADRGRAERGVVIED